MKLSKSDIAHLKDIANRLPICYTADNQKTVQFLYGHQLIARGITTIDKKAVIHDKKYSHSIEGGVKVNHFKQLKRLCEQGHTNRAQKYIDEVAGIGAEHFKLLVDLNSRKPRI